MQFFVQFRKFSSEICNCFHFCKTNIKIALIRKKGLFLELLFTIFCHQVKGTKIPSARISLTYIAYTNLAHPIDFFALPIWQKLRIYHVGQWFLFGATPDVDSYLRHFGAINKKMVNKI